MNSPVLILRVQGEAASQGFVDTLRDYVRSAPDRGGWQTIKARGCFWDVRRTGELLNARFTLRCCGCTACATQTITGRDCLGSLSK